MREWSLETGRLLQNLPVGVDVVNHIGLYRSDMIYGTADYAVLIWYRNGALLNRLTTDLHYYFRTAIIAGTDHLMDYAIGIFQLGMKARDCSPVMCAV